MRLLESKKKQREEALDRAVSTKKAGGGVAFEALNRKKASEGIGGEVVAAFREADKEGPANSSVPDEMAGLSEIERKRAELRRALSQRIKDDLSTMA